MKHDLALWFAIPWLIFVVYLKIRAAKKFSEENDQKADVTTLFDGEK